MGILDGKLLKPSEPAPAEMGSSIALKRACKETLRGHSLSGRLWISEHVEEEEEQLLNLPAAPLIHGNTRWPASETLRPAPAAMPAKRPCTDMAFLGDSSPRRM